MVQPVRPVQAFEVAVDRPWPARPVPMKETIMGQYIQYAIARHATAHPLQRRMAALAQGDQGGGYQRQRQQLEVIGFEHA